MNSHDSSNSHQQGPMHCERGENREDSTAPFPIVGIGASAGGLEAFMELLESLPPDTGMAFVLVQHLDPHHESALASILSRVTSMRVTEAQDGIQVVPNQVHVIPPNVTLVIRGGALHLTPRTEGPGRHMPIDSFLRSLAADRGSHAIAAILSGSANDGSLGLSAVKAEGGITFAQDETAKYQAMPRGAIATGHVDFILPPRLIAAELARIGKHPYLMDSPAAVAESPRGEPAAEASLKRLFGLLRKATGLDFSLYKQATLKRRILRRIALQKMTVLEDYVSYLEEHPGELEALCQDVLISVTSFFRTPRLSPS